MTDRARSETAVNNGFIWELPERKQFTFRPDGLDPFPGRPIGAARNLLACPSPDSKLHTMAGPGMHQTQNLSLQQVLAPQLQQSLLILQAPLLELRNLVQQEMETNPVLEELADPPNTDAPAESETPVADDNFKEEFDRL